MFSKVLVALAAASAVSAQTFTSCDPLKKTCPADAAFGNEKINCDLTKGDCAAFYELDGTELEYTDKGAVFKIEKGTNAPTIATHKYIFFGRLDVEVQAALGQGIVTSLVLQSDDLDEIDWEWVGGDNAQVQSNYFGKGDTTTYDRGAYHPVAEPLTTYHTYSIEYNSQHVNWIIDGAVVRTLNYADAKGGSRFPQTPMQIKLGTWVGGLEGKPQGTIDWAGGLTDFKQAPFNAYYKSISIVDYAGGDGPTDQSIKEYIYGDKSGSWESIKVVKGDGSSDDNDDDEKTTTSKEDKPKTTKSAEPTKTKSEEPKTTSEEPESTESASESKTKAPSSTTLATTTSAATPSGSASAGTTPSPDASETTGSPATVPTSAPGAASALNLGGALLGGAGLLMAQLLFI